MNNNNKILTVSYGTFSCTLEGFDDSFDTMKAIAEYFRDLAADDRYFGAEPPQPDAEMLARIAQRKVERRVEAREHDGRIMLKAHEETVVSTPAPVVEAEEAPQAGETDAEPAPTSQTDAPENDAAAATNDATALPAEPQAKASFEPVSEEPAPALRAKESELTTEVFAPETRVEDVQTVQAPDAEDVSDASLPSEAPLGTEEPQATTEAAERAETPAPIETDVAEADDAAAFFADSTVVDADEPDAEEAISVGDFNNYTARMDADANPSSDDLQDFTVEDVAKPGPAGSTESLVEKLDRIRAVVAQQEDAAYEDEGTASDDVTSHEMLEEAVTYDLAKEEENEAVAEAAKDITSALEFDDASETQISASEIAINEEDDLDAILKRIEVGNDDELDAPVDLSADIDDDEPAENLFDAPDEPEADAPEVHGRVLRVNRADLEAALESGDLEEYGDDTVEEVGDLSALDGEIPKEHQEDTPASPARGSLPEIDTDPSQDLSRLMAEADQHMQEPEGRTRRSAFAHLRAAVAARFADRSMEEEDTKGAQDAEAYRSDLAEVVKPRRPVASSTRSERPSEAPSAPLKLVAEQRIDAEEISARGPVAPRRVGTALDEDIDLAEDSGFAEYAEERGASSLPELLEAAASYLSFVEGHEQFSRPQLMARVRQADCGDFSREDGLRSFGQLLRAGKIEKIKGGRFAASQAIGYKPDHRAAG